MNTTRPSAFHGDAIERRALAAHRFDERRERLIGRRRVGTIATVGANETDHTIDGLREALTTDGLEDVVERVNLERRERVLVVRRHEHDCGHLRRSDLANHLEPVELRHLDVEEHEVRRQATNLIDGRTTVATLADDVDVAALPQ